jgi:di/tricarboxylate transporter
MLQFIKSWDRKVCWLGLSAIAGSLLWFMPTPEGLTVAGQHSLAVVIFTVLLWVSGAVPTGVGSLLMIGIVTCLMRKDVDTARFLSFWSQDTMWFVLMCFMFGIIMSKSGLGNRLATCVFSIRNLLLIDISLLLLNFLFSVIGMSSIFPKLALLMPLAVAVAAMSSMSKDDPYIRHVALMINIFANHTGLLVYSGFIMNPALGPLGGFDVDYIAWLEWFFVPALVYNVVSFAVVYFMFAPPEGSRGFDPEVIRARRRELGKVSVEEIKAVMWLLLAVGLWVSSVWTDIPTGYAAVLVAAMILLPGIGLVTFKEYVAQTDWNMVFMLMGVLSIGALGSTGFPDWLWGHILPNEMPGNSMLALMIFSFLVEILHIPLGSVGTTQALAIPSLVKYGAGLGLSEILVSIVAYISIVGQFFFAYQNAALVAGLGFGLWKPRDIAKFGMVMFFVTPVVLGVVLYPWWVFMGWIR